MGEETNYDLVLKYLYVEGYVETLEEAEEIMADNEDYIDNINKAMWDE